MPILKNALKHLPVIKRLNALQSTPDDSTAVYNGSNEQSVEVEERNQPLLPNSDEWSDGYPTDTFIDPINGLKTTRTRGANPVNDKMNIYRIYEDRAARMGNQPLFYFKKDGRWVSKTANETLADIRAVAKGLLQHGLQKGDTVAFMCHTCYEWDVFDAATMACGGILATIYDTDSAEQIRYIVNNSDAKLLMVETLDMRKKADSVKGECSTLKTIYCMESGALEELAAYGQSVPDAQLDERVDMVHKTDLCSIVYTSGSTAAPKGVEMTHEHYCTLAINLRTFLPDLLFDPSGSVLMFLPQAHSFARAINYGVVSGSIKIYIAGNLNTLISDLQVARPTVMIGVPRVFEKVFNAASQKAGHGPKGYLFQFAVKAAQDYMREMNATGTVTSLTAAKRASFDPMVYAPLRKALGGRAKWIVSGGAPLDPNLLLFFRGAKLPVYEGYGLTETTAPCTFSPLGTPFHEGSIGIAFPGFTLRIADDGEIQVKGTSVFHRYHKNEEATKESFTSDGWFISGDIGRLDNNGFFYITGRKKDLIITSGGKNVAPDPIEAEIQRCEIVSHAIILGDKRPFISALITLDEETLPSWIDSKGLDKSTGVDELAKNAVVRAEVQKFIDMANDGVSRAESVRKFIILPEDFTQENGLLTPSMKVIRPKVLKRYSQLLNTQMYLPKKK